MTPLVRQPLELQLRRWLGDAAVEVLEGSTDGLWFADVHRGEVWISPRLARMLGTSHAPHTHAWLDARVEPDTIPWSRQLRACMDEPTRHTWSSAFRALDGRARPVTWTPSLLRDAQGHVSHVLGVVRASVRSSLPDNIVSTFASAAAHDLRAPVRSVRQLSEWLLLDLASHVTEDTRELASLLHDCLDKMDCLVVGLERFGTVESIELDASATDLRAVLVSSVAARPRLELVRAPASMRATLARELLERVLDVLLDNALVHHDGDVCMLDIDVEPGVHEVVITITDDGPGVPDRVASHMFEPLRRGPSSPGVGLGLAVARRWTSLVDGRLVFVPTDGRGARFQLRWPASLHTSDEGLA